VGSWIVLSNYLDMLWIVLPAARVESPLAAVWYASSLVAISGACVAFACLLLRGKSLVPVGDPALPQSVAYRSPS
jgi:hypothetical protein